MNEDSQIPQVISWQDGVLSLLDQRLLPDEERYLNIDTCSGVMQAIIDMVVRGAPAIGISAAYGVVLSAQQHQSKEAWRELIEHDIELLRQARPTAVNLHWALERMARVLSRLSQLDTNSLLAEAVYIHQNEVDANLKMSEKGAELLPSGARVLTHCNTGTLATAGHGTALGVIRAAYKQGKIKHVYAGETRPWLQGARLTAWELIKDDIPVTLLCEGAAPSLISRGEVDWVIVGADRIAANGDVANKIGTYALAMAARFHNIKFMVVAPLSTLDISVRNGDDIPIEYRSADELFQWQGQRIAAKGVDGWNPVFDITPAELIDVIVTEDGIIAPPYALNIKKTAKKRLFSSQ